MTIKEYNEKWFRLKNNATIFLARYDHALFKCNDYQGAKQQLELLGFDDELVEYLKDAVSYYHSLKKDEMYQDNCTYKEECRYCNNSDNRMCNTFGIKDGTCKDFIFSKEKYEKALRVKFQKS